MWCASEIHDLDVNFEPCALASHVERGVRRDGLRSERKSQCRYALTQAVSPISLPVGRAQKRE